jgi:RimJ/RimL family protein N-acetyltransferase
MRSAPRSPTTCADLETGRWAGLRGHPGRSGRAVAHPRGARGYDPGMRDPIATPAPVVPAPVVPAPVVPAPATRAPAAPWVTPVTLVGRRVRLEPLEPAHLPGLVAAGADPATWTWLHAPLTDEASMRAWVEEALRNRDAGTEVPFATVDAATGRVLGSTRFMSIAPAHRRLEIGWTWLTPTALGTGANTEAKLLLLEHALGRLGAMRVEFKTDARNVRARAAHAGIGATFEGIFRRHQVMAGGRVRDSAWYAILDEDWPAVLERLRARLAGPEEGAR